MRAAPAAMILALLAASLSAQTTAPGPAKPASADPSRAPVRMADGKPDLTGVWQGGSTRRGNWEEANSGLGVGGTGRDLTAPPTPASGQVVREPAPYQPWAAKKVLEVFNRRGIDDPTGMCLPPGMPRAAIVGLFHMQIIHKPQEVEILYEYMNVFRVIPINAKHPDDLVPTYMGDSVGRWEGDTLVVDVVGFNDKTWLTGTGTFHSEGLHITERYTRIDKDQINYDVTMEDPAVLTKPWTIRSTMMLREGTRLQEYVCAENNLDPAHYEKLLKDGVNFTRQ
ncbi:MAG: hypothetical protein EHM89_03310 [Acidobacteria bacterium]|nr:MAG: hypothetical protein EHM89_03310 [Acidobacteriota bacterium]